MTRWLEEKGWPKILSILASMSLLMVLLSGLVILLVKQFSQFLNRWPRMQVKLETAISDAAHNTGTLLGFSDLEKQEWINSMIQNFTEYLLNWLPQSLYRAGINLVLILLVPFYIILMLYYRRMLVEALHGFIKQWSFEQLKEILDDSIHTYFRFIKGMTLVYLIVGILNSIGLALIGIPNAILFGFIASILTFIPYVGISIGALLPITISWLIYDSLWYPVAVIATFVFIQILEANIIFPIVVGHQLKINALAAILIIVFGGLLWGAAGMVLFLPFVAILKLVIDKVNKEHPFATLLQA
ncbi:MAG: AI-2E family transporter [Cyclobacteriaceae bacterium]|nr:MAG: AI-2E family transporter [Cyclobacteriaceae bacterium]